MTALGWWDENEGTYICRHDERGDLRRFQVGKDGIRVLSEWLKDWHRRRALQSCARVAVSLKRDGAAEPNIAQGLDLPGVPPGTMCRFAGHKETWGAMKSAALQHASLATACSFWLRRRLRGHAVTELCLCGRLRPSRPHLVWACPDTEDLKDSLAELFRSFRLPPL